MANTEVKELLSEIYLAEDEASKASSHLQRAREEVIRRFSPVHAGDVLEWSVDETNVNVKVFNVQVAKSGRFGHKFVASAYVLTHDGVETTNHVYNEYDLNDQTPEAVFARSGKGVSRMNHPPAKTKPASRKHH